MTDSDYERARRLLARRDPVLGALIRRVGRCGMGEAQRTDHFAAIVRAITAQQLSAKASRTIYNRLAALFPDETPTPARLSALTDEQLRAIGYSRQKLSYLRDLAAKVEAGAVRLEGIEAREDEAVITELVRIKGIGRWSAEMFLMFRLQRPDVLPVDDLGIVTAVQRLYRLRKRPTPERLTTIAAPWRPYRSIACWYLWRSLDNLPAE
jgi:DNA-3-methyladenine glycosylase II